MQKVTENHPPRTGRVVGEGTQSLNSGLLEENEWGL
jgi:hypothetical protein